MKRVLLINPSAKHRAGVTSLLGARGFSVGAAASFQGALAALSAAGSRGSDLVGVVVGWPRGPDPAFHAFVNALSDHAYSHLAVLLVADEVSPTAIAWLKQRKRSALLLWNDHSEIPDAMAKLLDPYRRQRQSFLEELTDYHLRVLFVDDSPTVRIAFRRMLMKYGFVVETAASAIEGYRKALQMPFDLAIIDYFMPGQNGVALVRKLRMDPNTQRIVTAIITGTYSDTVINEALAAGASECIFKSEARDLFLARVASLARSIVDRKSIDRERRRLEGILRSVGDGVYGVDSRGYIQFINPAARDILDFTSESEIIGSRSYDLFHNRFEDGKPMEADSCFLSQCYQTGNQISGWQTTFWSHSGRAIPVECTVFPLEIDGQRRGSVVAFRDVSARKQLEEELRWQATHDSLTKLHNRSHFETELEQELHRLKRSDQVSALLFVDLDRFKYINDTAGHTAGDRLLLEVAERLSGRLRISDSLARIGGDEYAVILRNVRSGSIKLAADQFRHSLEETPFHYGGKQYLISATVGVALMDRDTVSPGDVMANADIACHLAKNQGRNRVHVFSSETDQKAAMDLELGWSTRLRNALSKDLFTLWFQPILAADRINFEELPLQEGSLWRQHHPARRGETAAYEVLLRLKDSGGNLIAPDAFLPTAGRFNMMVDIDRWVIEKAFKTLGELVAAGRSLCFSVNLSEQSVLDPELIDFVARQLDENQLDGSHVTFELAEAVAVTNVEATKRMVSELKALGCRIGLDDFGTGFASFTHLKQIDVDYLKIDGAYMRNAGHDPINAAVLAAIAKIAHALGKETIAECVDSATIVESLKNSGIDQLQGYFIARPQQNPETPPGGNVTPISRGLAG